MSFESMLRILYFACVVLGNILAVLSPVAILLWLVDAQNIKDINNLIQPIQAIFVPFNSILDSFIKFPTIDYQERHVSITQGVLGFVFTTVFFILNVVGNVIKDWDEQLSSRQSLWSVHVKDVQQNTAKNEMEERKRLTERLKATKFIVYIQFPFQENEALSPFFNAYGKFNGRAIQAQTTGLYLAFESINQAIEFTIETAQGLLVHYMTLRPLDPQPSFRMSINSFVSQADLEQGTTECRQIVRYASDNQVVFSSNVRQFLDVANGNDSYKFQSKGVYDFNGSPKEIFHLLLKSLTKPVSPK
jgi:hypothetical protein